jgi:hypothetical protein
VKVSNEYDDNGIYNSNGGMFSSIKNFKLYYFNELNLFNFNYNLPYFGLFGHSFFGERLGVEYIPQNTHVVLTCYADAEGYEISSRVELTGRSDLSNDLIIEPGCLLSTYSGDYA